MYKANDLLYVELQATSSWREETDQILGQMKRAMEQSESAMEQMERMMEEMIIENKRAMNFGEEMNEEHEG